MQFKDESINAPASWLWEFGDGGQSTEQNPTHTYQKEGIYTVKLSVTKPECGMDMLKKENLITVKSTQTVADFSASPTVGFAPLKVRFTDLSEPRERITGWIWEFGDGANDTRQNPEHEYRTEGFYTVRLTVTASNTDVEVKTNLIIVKPQGAPIADFMASPTAGLTPLSVRFADLSEPSGQIDSWIWDFGNGGIAAEQNPKHIYKVDGIYSVRLTVSNAGGADTETKVNLIGARGTPVPIADFTASPTAGQSPLRVNFTDNSTGDGISSRVWDFGDGATSTEQNPVHTYKAAGAFTVKLTVSNEAGAMQRPRQA